MSGLRLTQAQLEPGAERLQYWERGMNLTSRHLALGVKPLERSPYDNARRFLQWVH